MGSTRRVVLQLEVITTGQPPITGLVRACDGLAHAFSGWSEMFAVLQTLTAESGDDTEPEAST